MKKQSILILICCSLLLGCSTLSKQRSAQKHTNSIESQSAESSRHQLDSQANQWLQSQIHQLRYNTTLIHSDSSISYQPGSGFKLSSGTIVLTEASRQSSLNQAGISNEKQESNHVNQQSILSQHEQQSNKQIDKERLPSIPSSWLALFCIIALLSPLLLVYLNKKNKR